MSKHFGRLKFQEENHITGRGMILVLDLVENRLAEEPIKTMRINVEDTVTYRRAKYKVSAIEAARKNESIDKMVGLVVIPL